MRISDWSSDVCSSDLFELLRETKAAKPKQELHMLLSEGLPRRLALMLCEEAGLGGRLADLSDKKLRAIAGLLKRWRLRPGGTEGFRNAEVSTGGHATAALSPQPFEAERQSAEEGTRGGDRVEI